MAKHFLLAIFLSWSASVSAATPGPRCTADVDALYKVVEISLSENEQTRLDTAADLENFIGSMSDEELNSIDDRTIEAITLLLGHKEYWIQVSAATTLGLIGPRAKKSLPALERLSRTLKEPKPEEIVGLGIALLPPVDGVQQVKDAIEKIRK